MEFEVHVTRRLRAEGLIDYPIADPAVEEAIERHFHVVDRYLDADLPTYIVGPRGEGDGKRLLKTGFKQLVDELRPLGYLPRLRFIAGRHAISVLQKPPPRPHPHALNVILFAATAGTIFFDGFQRSNNPILSRVLMPGTPVLVNALLFTLAILGIFGLHELGHKAVSLIKGVETSMPYFIPAPPGFGGTFGAIITQREPPANRDDLFDLGFSGPLVGFLITLLVSIIGLRLSFVVSGDEMAAWMALFPEVRFQSISFPILVRALASAVRPTPGEMVMILHPVGFAAWVGCIVTFINLIPSWQLDGGHISRAMFGEKRHRLLSLAGVFLMLITGYVVMAIVLAFFMMRSGRASVAPLDDISPLSPSRKLLSIVYLMMIILTMVVITPL